METTTTTTTTTATTTITTTVTTRTTAVGNDQRNWTEINDEVRVKTILQTLFSNQQVNKFNQLEQRLISPYQKNHHSYTKRRITVSTIYEQQ